MFATAHWDDKLISLQFEFYSSSIYGIICSLTLILTDAWFTVNLKVAFTNTKMLNYDRIENVRVSGFLLQGRLLISTCFHLKHQTQGKLKKTRPRTNYHR